MRTFISLCLLGCLGAVLAMPPRPGLTLPQSAYRARRDAGVDIARVPVRDVGKATLFNSYRTGNQLLVSGVKRFPVVTMAYPDYANQYATGDFDQMLFGSWPSGSAHDFYRQVSYGQLTLEGATVGWFTASRNRSYYGYLSGFGRAAQLAKEAAQAADPSVNYADYDLDGDGYVDVFTVIHAGFGMEETGDFSDIWSHMWYLSAGTGSEYVTGDPDPNRPGEFIKVDLYTMQPERSNLTNNGSMVTIGVFCHEWGHGFGLPDLYDTDGGGEGLGDWCLMAAGSWGGDGSSPWLPVQMSVWCKTQLGWLTPRVVTENGPALVPRVETDTVTYQLWSDGAPTAEYFLVENRQKTLNDQNLPTSGLAIYHIDENIISQYAGSNEVNAGVGGAPYGVALEQADGRNDLYQGSNRGDAGDLYPGSSANPAFDSLGTTPDSRSNAGANTHCGVNQIPPPDSTVLAYFYIAAEQSGNRPPGPFSLIAPADHDTTDRRPTFVWHQSSDPDGDTVRYNLYYDTDSLFATSTIVFAIAETSYTVTTDLADTTYYWKVEAADGRGGSVWSNETDWSFVVRGSSNNPPGPFSLFLPACGDTTDGRPVFQWDQSIDPDGEVVTYTLLYTTDPDYNSYVAVPNIVATYYQPDAALDDAVYYWKVRATDPESAATWSNETDWYFAVVTNQAPQTFSLISPANGSQTMARPRFLWHAATDPDGDSLTYTVRIGEDIGFVSYIEAPGLTDTTFAPDYDLPDGPYWWKVKATDPHGDSVWSRETWGFAVRTAGVEDQAGRPHAFELTAPGPNPARGRCRVELALPRPVMVELAVYDASGMLVRVLASGARPAGVHRLTWDGTGRSGTAAPAGIYFFRVRAGDYRAVRKVVMTR